MVRWRRRTSKTERMNLATQWREEM